MKVLGSVQVLRGIAALGVVLFHASLIEARYSGGDTLLPSIVRIGQSGVDLFFVISGFIMVTITSSSSGYTGHNVLRFLGKRFGRVYPNYWFYLLLTLAVYFINPSVVNSSQGNRIDIFSSFFLFPTPNPAIIVSWSLTFEIFFYLVFSLLLLVKRRFLVWFLLLWLAFLITVNCIYQFRSVTFIELIGNPYSIEFIFGAFAGVLVNSRIVQRLPVMVLAGTIVAVIVLLPVLYNVFYSRTNVISLWQPLLFGPAYAIFLLVTVILERRFEIRFPKPLVKLGDISYTIYLSHVLILGATGRIWSAYFQSPVGLWDNLIFIMLQLGLVIGYSLIAYKMIEQPLTAVFSKRKKKTNLIIIE